MRAASEGLILKTTILLTKLTQESGRRARDNVDGEIGEEGVDLSNCRAIT
jgi:hypothetical protein